MAFTCEGCLGKQYLGKKKSNKSKVEAKVKAAEDFSWRPRSFGPCESCRKPKECINA